MLYFDSENIILYGATANALWALRHANSIAYIHDDNKILSNYSMYRKKSIIPIKNKFIFDDCASNIILITAYLHDDNIVKKIKLRNKNCMEIYTINPSKFMNNLNNNVVKKL